MNEAIFASAIGFGKAERSFTGIAWLYRSTIWSRFQRAVVLPQWSGVRLLAEALPANAEWILQDDHGP